MTTCQDLDVLISLRAAGALDPEESRRLEAHLAGCARCRAEAAADDAVLGLARLPAPTEAEKRAAAGVAQGALAELHRRERRTSSWKRAAAGFAAAAALLVAVLAPAMLGRRAVLPPPDTAAVAESDAPAWQEPDLDTLWSDAGVLDDDASSTTSDTAADAALVAFDL